MTNLETQLSTLRDGAEAVGLVMRNWEGVLGVIGMAGKAAGEAVRRQGGDREGEGELPVTLVRIPVEEGGGNEGV